MKTFGEEKRINNNNKAHQALLKAGLSGTEVEKRISVEWRQLIRQHNKLRVALQKKKDQKAKISAEKSFKEDPNKFAKKIFAQKKPQGVPQFSADDAYTYFEKNYHDAQRNCTYSALPQMVRPEIPSHFFSTRSPSLQQLSKSTKR